MIKLIIIITASLTTIQASHGHAPVGQYVHVAAVPYPILNHPNPPPPAYQTYQPYQPAPPKSAPVMAPTVPATAPSLEIPAIESLKPSTKQEQKLPNRHKPLDSNVLNNLAIALQLLIVSNILNRPTQDTDPEIAANLALSALDGQDHVLPTPYSSPVPLFIDPPYVLESSAYALEPRPRYIVQESPPIPNSKYLGSSSSIVDSHIYTSQPPRPSPRSSAGLMSPYESLITSSEHLLSSSYGPYSKKDFRSPYAMMSESKDLFSISDLF